MLISLSISVHLSIQPFVFPFLSIFRLNPASPYFLITLTALYEGVYEYGI